MILRFRGFLPLVSGLVALVVLLSGGFFIPAHAAESMTRDQLTSLLRQVLRDDPNILFDVLRDHSEVVLDIAQQGSNQRRFKNLKAQWQKELSEPKQAALENRPLRGAQDAPVTIVAFSDFTCPYCMQAAGTIRTLLREHEGNIRYVFKHFPLEGHKYSRLAAEYHVAASLQGDDKAWALYDVLFNSGIDLNEGGEAMLKKAAEDAGLDMKKLNNDLRTNAGRIKAIIDEDLADGKRLGIQGTPNFLVNNLVVRGALSADLFNQAIVMALEHAKAKR